MITRQRVPSAMASRIAIASPTVAASLVGQPPLSTIRAVMARAPQKSSRTTTKDGASEVNAIYIYAQQAGIDLNAEIGFRYVVLTRLSNRSVLQFTTSGLYANRCAHC